MAEVQESSRFQRRDRRNLHDSRGTEGNNYAYHHRSRDGRLGNGGNLPNHRTRNERYKKDGGWHRADDRFRLFRFAAKERDWKNDRIEYSRELPESVEEEDSRFFSKYDNNAIQSSLRLLWSASPEPMKNIIEHKKRWKGETDTGSQDESSTSSSSDESSSEESRRRSRRREKRYTSRNKRRNERRRRKTRRRRYSTSSNSSDSISESSDNESNYSRRSDKRTKHSHQIASAATPAYSPDSSDSESVGPKPPSLQDTTAATSFVDAGGGKAKYGKALLPGEGSAMAQYVQNNMRVPRRGEIGYGAEEIDKFEKSGYVMSGSRHARMNAVRIRKENQVYTAEEQRALAMITLEEKAEKEKALVQDFRAMLEQKLEKKEGKKGH